MKLKKDVCPIAAFAGKNACVGEPCGWFNEKAEQTCLVLAMKHYLLQQAGHIVLISEQLEKVTDEIKNLENNINAELEAQLAEQFEPVNKILEDIDKILADQANTISPKTVSDYRKGAPGETDK